MNVIRWGCSFSVLLIVLMAGAFKVDGQGQTLNPANQIVLNAQGQQSGQFNGPDLTVNYTYVCSGSDMQINGSIQFGMAIQANYAVVQTFQLGLALADAQGNVLEQRGLTTSYDHNVGDTINFCTSVAVPAQTASMAFTYTGQVYAEGSGGPDPTNIYFYPFTN